MPTTDPVEAGQWLRLALIPGVGAVTLRSLLTEFGSPEAILAASQASLRKLAPPEVAAAIADGGNAEATEPALAWLEQPDNYIVTLADAEYPQLLLQTVDPPPLLYVKGRLELLNRPALAIVGSRNSTAQGAENAAEFARALSIGGLTIVSGLALGIDAAAHRGGLAGAGSSVAFVGTGLDVVYPARNKSLAHELAAKGALISEYPLGTPPLAANFPRRNRLISGVSLGCLVVEAALQSGSLITARLANEQGREVFALPGSIHSPLAKGCHRLIKQGAKLVDDANDILDELKLTGHVSNPRIPPAVDSEQAALLEHLGYEPCEFDLLCTRAGIGADTAAGLLLTLELCGLVESLPGGRYQRIR
ncbi:MAG: protecting protein DprA [Betaproteobacteria bacterium]|nr:protecting protein DprA [Betaproteobacteria bacterium]